MTAGRPPVPPAILKLYKGELYDKQRDRVENTPKPKAEKKPRCPKTLTKEEKREWRYYARLLENYELFTTSNELHLEMLARYVCHYKNCAQKVSEFGLIVKGKQGEPKTNEFFKKMKELDPLIKKTMQELGLGESILQRLGAKIAKRKNEAEDDLPLD